MVSIVVGDTSVDAAGQFAASTSNGLMVVVGDASGNQAQLNAIAAAAVTDRASSWDAVALSATGWARSGDGDGENTQIGTGAYLEGRRGVRSARAFGAEIRCRNDVAGDPPVYAAAGAGATMALWVACTGYSDSEAAIKIGTGDSTRWLVGLGLVGNSVVDASIRDDSQSLAVLDARGSHTYVIDTLNASLSGGAIRLARAHYITWRNTAGDADLGEFVGVDGNNRLRLGRDSTSGIYLSQSTILNEGRNLVFGTTTGTKIANGTAQKMAFSNATPVLQPTAVGDVTGGGQFQRSVAGSTVDSEARSAINALLSRL